MRAHVLYLSLALLAGRITGFIRETSIVKLLGVSIESDLAIFFNSIPDLLVSLLLSGGISVALIPVFHTQSVILRINTLFVVSAFVFGLFFLIATVFWLFIDLWYSLFIPGLPSIEISKVVKVDMVTLVAASIPFTALSGVISSLLQSEEKFIMSGIGTFVFNVSLLICLYFAHSDLLFFLTVGVFAGSLIRLLVQVSALELNLVSFKLLYEKREFFFHTIKGVFKPFLAGFLSVSCIVVVPFVLRSCASLLGPGSMTGFNYAIKLVELPIGVFIYPITIVLFSKLCELEAEKKVSQFNNTFINAANSSLFISLSLCFWGYVCSNEIVWVLSLAFGLHESIDANSIANLLRIAFVSVPLVGLSGIFTSVLNAVSKPAWVFFGNVACITVLIVYFWGLSSIEAFTDASIMFGLPLFYTLNTLALVIMVRFRLRLSVVLLNRETFSTLLFVVVVCLIGFLIREFLYFLVDSGPILFTAQLLCGGIAFLLCLRFSQKLHARLSEEQ